MRKYGNYIEGVSKNKLYKQGYSVYVTYWSDRINQQNMLLKLVKDKEYLYTQKRDESGLFKIIVYTKD